MDAIKNSLKSVRASVESIPFLKFMVKAGVYVFAGGGLLWLVAGFVPSLSGGGFFLKTLFATLGRVAIVLGLLFAVLNEEELILMIASAAISVGALVVGIVEVAAGLYRGYLPNFESWFFFLLFGGLAALVFIFGSKMKEYRAKAKQNSQARAAQQAAARQAAAAQQVQLIECPNCKGPVPINVQFCSNCGAPNPAMQYQQAPPTQAAPPAPPQAPPAAPVADTAAPLEAAPAAAPAPPVAPAPPQAPAAPAVKKCVSCGAELNADAVFCGQCGAKQ